MSPVTISHRSHRRPVWRPRHPYCRCRPSSITDHTRCRVRCPARRAGSARYVIHPMRHRADRLRTPSTSVARPAGREPGCAGYRPARRLRRTTWRAVTSPRRSRSRFPRRRLHRACAGRRPGWSATSWAIPAFSEQVQLPCPLSTTAACRCRHHHWPPELRAVEPPEAAAQ
jgi:hypothetical protein